MKITKAKPTPAQTPAGELTIKNWDKYQSLSKTGKPLSWLRDYADQAVDLDYSRLSLFERGLLQECRRLCTRTGGRPIHADITYIARACNIKDTDRARLEHALDTLIQRGFLIPVESTNVISRAEESRGEKRHNQRQSGAPEKGSVSPDQKAGTRLTSAQAIQQALAEQRAFNEREEASCKSEN